MSDQKPMSKAGSRKKVIRSLKDSLEDALATIQPSEDATNPEKGLSANDETGSTAMLKRMPVCITQAPLPANLAKNPDPFALEVGLFGPIPRWKKGQTVNFAAYSGGYPAAADAVFAVNQLNKAATIWTNLNVGIKFKWVGKLEDAAFVLAYGGDLGNTVARAYFPNPNDLNTVSVYKRAFDADTKPHMWNFFLHELGHVLGLRHEFAMDINPNTNKPKEGGAVQFGVRNEKSVMNYRNEPPQIQESDRASTKAFYDYTGTAIQSMVIQDWIPDN